MDEEIIEALLKRAKGYSYNEVQEEYSVKEDGEIALTKRKVMEKYCPPDSTALKTYMDICGERGVETYTDEELEEEKNRLLKQLYLEEQSSTVKTTEAVKKTSTITKRTKSAKQTKTAKSAKSVASTTATTKQTKSATIKKQSKTDEESENDGI